MKLITQNRFSRVKILALFVFTFSMVCAYAGQNHPQGSSLRLLLPPNGEHAVMIDNMSYNGIYDRFKVDNLRPGNHRIKIVQFVVSKRGRARIVDKILIFNGMVFIPKNAKVWASVSNGRLFIERTFQRDNSRGRYEDNRKYDNNRDDYDGGRNDNRRDDYYDDDWYGYNDQNREDQGDRSGGDSYDQRNSQNETFALTLRAIKKRSFDSDRLKIAKNAVKFGNMYSREIAEIAKQFSFESTRLEFAKYAYQYTIDRENYVIVQDAFKFRSSTSELQDYITQMGNR